jgi:hypothetical protein
MGEEAALCMVDGSFCRRAVEITNVEAPAVTAAAAVGQVVVAAAAGAVAVPAAVALPAAALGVLVAPTIQRPKT